jgi:outer membrane receptor protein involved in Fe transport
MGGNRTGEHSSRPSLVTALLASSMLSAPALAQEVANNTGIETIIVTAQKRSEDIQKVPLSIQALPTEKLGQLHISSFDDYAKYFPGLTYTVSPPGNGGGNGGPTSVTINMRGIVSGNDGNHSGPLPTVGVYLDEQPITSIDGTLDPHIYDISRIEVLSGPQGTLYGASSEAGTVRIITNKPDESGFSAAYDVQGNTVDHGDLGYTVEGYVNEPISNNAAIRLVAWDEHDAGYIDNVRGTRTYPGCVAPACTGTPVPPITINNFGIAKNAFNDVDIYGGRAALQIDLNDSWTITPTVIAQWENTNGVFGYDPSVGYLEVKHFFKEYYDQNWVQAALTVQGKIGDLDLTYSGGHQELWDHGQSDYTDYSYWYDKLFPASFPAYFYNNAGNFIAPSQDIFQYDHFIKDSQEIRVASPSSDRLRFIVGLFWESQNHWILQNYKINDLTSNFWVTGWPDTLWLTDQERTDRDAAVFGEVSYDITPQLTLTGGIRLYDYNNELKGFFGFNANFSSHTGESQCFGPGMFHNAPCTDLNAHTAGTGNTHKINLTYHFDDERMVYFTWSTGFRPGGINRRGDVAGPYSADKLTNYEVGFKTQWLDDTLRVNGALFRENWDNIQFPFLGINSFTLIQNAGNATSQGIEGDFEWKPIPQLTLSGSGAVTDANLDTNYCGFNNPPTKQPITGNCAQQEQLDGLTPYPPEAPAGTQLPITPKWKGNLTARYDFPIFGDMAAHAQGSMVSQSSAWDDLRIQAPLPISGVEVPIRTAIGKQPGWTQFDFSVGVDSDIWYAELFVQNAFNVDAQQYRYAECITQVCENQPYVVPARPRLIGLKFGQRF